MKPTPSEKGERASLSRRKKKYIFDIGQYAAGHLHRSHFHNRMGSSERRVRERVSSLATKQGSQQSKKMVEEDLTSQEHVDIDGGKLTTRTVHSSSMAKI